MLCVQNVDYKPVCYHGYQAESVASSDTQYQSLMYSQNYVVCWCTETLALQTDSVHYRYCMDPYLIAPCALYSQSSHDAASDFQVLVPGYHHIG